LLSSQLSSQVTNKLLSQYPLENSRVSILDNFEEEITFYCSDGNREDDDEDVLMEIKPCTPFGSLLFPHHDDVFPQAPCEAVPTSRETMHHKHACHDVFIDKEHSPAITMGPTVGEPTIGEPTVGELTIGKLTVGEPTIDKPAANAPDLFQCTKSTTRFLSENGQDFPSDPKIPSPKSCLLSPLASLYCQMILLTR